MNHSEKNKKAAATRKAKDPEAFKKMGAKGGKHSTSRGFRDIPGLASRAALRSVFLRRYGGLDYEHLDSDPRK